MLVEGIRADTCSLQLLEEEAVDSMLEQLAAVGASTRRTWRTAQEGRARRAPAKGICVGHAAAGSEAQDEPEALRRRGPAAAAQTACCTLQ